MRNIRLFIITALLGLALIACDSRVTPQETIEGYYVEGALVKNIDLDQAEVLVVVQRNDSVLTSAVVTIGDDTLAYSGGMYRHTYTGEDIPDQGAYYLKVVDSTIFADSIAFGVPGNFQITSILPANRILRPIDMASVEWTTAFMANGYVYGAVKKTDIYSDTGFAEFVTSLTSAVTMDREAFSLPGGELDTGLYYIYLYAYAGSPLPGSLIPTSFPEGLTNNIVRDNLTAKFGAVTVCEHDSLSAETL